MTADNDEPERTGSQAYRVFLRARSRRLREEAEEAGFFDHRLTSGEAREAILRGPLEEVLPWRYGVGSGEVLAHDDSVSGQWDVILFDRENTPHLYQSATAAKYPIETVLSAISVKSEVDRTAIHEVVEAATRLRQMPRATVPVLGMTRTTSEAYPLIFLYGFRGVSLGTVLKHLHEAVSIHETPINGICVHGSGVVMPVDEQGPTYSTTGIRQYNYAEAGDGAFGLFISLLYAGLAGAPLAAPDLPRYMNLGRLAGHVPEDD